VEIAENYIIVKSTILSMIWKNWLKNKSFYIDYIGLDYQQLRIIAIYYYCVCMLFSLVWNQSRKAIKVGGSFVKINILWKFFTFAVSGNFNKTKRSRYIYMLTYIHIVWIENLQSQLKYHFYWVIIIILLLSIRYYNCACILPICRIQRECTREFKRKKSYFVLLSCKPLFFSLQRTLSWVLLLFFFV